MQLLVQKLTPNGGEQPATLSSQEAAIRALQPAAGCPRIEVTALLSFQSVAYVLRHIDESGLSQAMTLNKWQVVFRSLSDGAALAWVALARFQLRLSRVTVVHLDFAACWTIGQISRNRVRGE